MENRANQLQDYIRNNLSKDPSQPASVSDPLMSSGLVDSFSIVEILVFIEEEWGVVIPDQEATTRRFDSIEKIMEVVAEYDDDEA